MLKTLEGKYYINLYTASSKILKSLVQENQSVIIGTNCISLVAGLTFNSLKDNKLNIKIVYFEEFGFDEKIEKNTIYLLIMNREQFDNFLNKDLLQYFIEYIGDEGNILRC